MKVNERRMMILELLCERRNESIENLMFEFNASNSTIRRDIQELSISYPIYTTQGNGGGVHAVEGWYLGRKYLKPNQQELLEKLTYSLEGKELETMQSILASFAMNNPKRRNL